MPARDTALICILFCSLALVRAAQPDPRTLAARAVELNLAAWDRIEDYVYVERVVAKRLSGDGKVKSSRNKTHEVTMIHGSPYRRLLLENDQPVSAEEAVLQQEALRRQVEARGAESPKEREKRLNAYRKKRQEYRDALSEIPEAFNFRLAGEEITSGRPAWIIELTPRRGFQPRNRYARLFTAVKGKVWIDKASGNWIRLEAESFDSLWFGWILVRINKGARIRMEQQPVGDGLWLPKSLWFSAGVRVGFLYSFGVEEDSSYRDYRKPTAPGGIASSAGMAIPRR